MRFINSAILLVAVLVFGTFSAFAQESEPVVIDEVVAQVNDGVITLSRVKREMNDVADSLVKDQGKTPEAAKKEVEGKKGELIANLINEELVLQKGKEMNIDTDIDAQINQRFLQIMKEQNIKTLDALYKAMESAGVKPEELRENWRKQFTREEVFRRDVDSKIYLGWTAAELKDYFQKHPEKFTKPESVTLSEIFLGYAGRDEKAVRAKADQLIAEIRGGADFVKKALENSDSPDVQQNKGSVGTFPIKELTDKVAAAIKGLKVGGVAKIEAEEGIEILHVDSRTNADSTPVFAENAVRTAMTYDKLPDERKKYLVGLRKDAYIKISKDYVAMITPFLAEEAKTAVKSPGK